MKWLEYKGHPLDMYNTDFSTLTLMECIHGPEEDFGYTKLFQKIHDFKNKEIVWQFLKKHKLPDSAQYINLCKPVKYKHLMQLATNQVPSNYCQTCQQLKPCLL